MRRRNRRGQFTSRSFRPARRRSSRGRGRKSVATSSRGGFISPTMLLMLGGGAAAFFLLPKLLAPKVVVQAPAQVSTTQALPTGQAIPISTMWDAYKAMQKPTSGGPTITVTDASIVEA